MSAVDTETVIDRSLVVLGVEVTLEPGVGYEERMATKFGLLLAAMESVLTA